MTFAKDDRVKVDNPAWKDATGKVHDAGLNHGKTGKVLCHYNDGLVDVEFDDGKFYPHWSSELKPTVV